MPATFVGYTWSAVSMCGFLVGERYGMSSVKGRKTEERIVLFVIERKAERVGEDRAGLQDILIIIYLIDISEYYFS